MYSNFLWKLLVNVSCVYPPKLILYLRYECIADKFQVSSWEEFHFSNFGLKSHSLCMVSEAFSEEYGDRRNFTWVKIQNVGPPQPVSVWHLHYLPESQTSQLSPLRNVLLHLSHLADAFSQIVLYWMSDRITKGNILVADRIKPQIYLSTLTWKM